MARPQPASHHLQLVEPWLAELDRLSRRRAESLAAIDKHIERFEGALLDWKATTGQDIEPYRERLRHRIHEIIESPWPKSKERIRKLSHAQQRLEAGTRRRS